MHYLNSGSWSFGWMF